MKSKKKLLKELGWSDELIDFVLQEQENKQERDEQEYIEFENPIRIQHDTTNIILSMDEPLWRSGKFLF